MTRFVSPVPATLVTDDTLLAPNSKSLAFTVVSDPESLLVPLPVAPTEPSTGETLSKPRYARMRISGYGTAALKVTVTVFLFADAATTFVAT